MYFAISSDILIPNMKIKYFFLAVFALGLVFVLPSKVSAHIGDGPTCPYKSTESRVQQNLKNPWVSVLEIPLRRPLNGWTRFKVGSFHNGTGVFATDTNIRVVGPGFDRYAQNGQTIWVNREGEYRVIVTTRFQAGEGCTDTSYVMVRRPKGL